MGLGRTPRIVVAPDSFKESLSSERACAAIARGIRRAIPGARIVRIPMADGGEGTLAALLANMRGKAVAAQVQDPLGRRVRAKWGWVPSTRTAIVEMAEASGLVRIPPKLRNPMATHSFGTGELIRAALDRGAKTILLTLGGVATNDAGAGMAEALGYRFLDRWGNPVARAARGLAELERIDASRVHPRLRRTRFIAACDVTNPLCGPRGSARVFGPQKGATPEMIPKIDAALRRFARAAKRSLGRNILNVSGGGAAGGAGAGAMVFLHATLKPGVRIVSDAAGLERKMKGADLVVTGEGKIDAQTRFGKTPWGVARIARKLKVPVVAFCGSLEADAAELKKIGIDSAYPIQSGTLSRKTAMKRAGILLEKKAGEAFRRLA